MLNPTVLIPATGPGTIHIVGVGGWIVSGRDVSHVAVLVTAIIASSILLGDVI